MYRIALIIPYFGNLPKYSELFFESLKYNNNLDVFILTDQNVNYELNNLHVINTGFECVQKRIRSTFGFKVNIDRPYKLCDYRPAYAIIFADLIKGYDFWGYCDLDLVFGDTKRFLTDKILSAYDKIYQHSHLSLFRNSPEINKEFISDFGMNYRDVYSTPVNCVFDEIPGIQQKFDHDILKTYKKWDFYDVNPWKYHMTRVVSHVPDSVLNDDFDFNTECFYWDKGHLFRAALKDEKIITNEYIYLHFQKRDYDVSKYVPGQPYFLSNEGCEPMISRDLCEMDLDKYNKRSLMKELQYTYRQNKNTWDKRVEKYIKYANYKKVK